MILQIKVTSKNILITIFISKWLNNNLVFDNQINVIFITKVCKSLTKITRNKPLQIIYFIQNLK